MEQAQPGSSPPDALLAKLTTSLESCNSILPAADSLQPPENGISLLDTKNELFLSYLQSLVFLMYTKLRQTQASGAKQTTDGTNPSTLDAEAQADGGARERDGTANKQLRLEDKIVRHLVELRVYLDKGVRSLEGRLRYQIDKVVKAAEAESTRKAVNGNTATKAKKSKTSASSKKIRKSIENGFASGSGSGSDSNSHSDSNSDSDSDSDHADPATAALAYRPNLDALLANAGANASTDARQPSASTTTAARSARPPRSSRSPSPSSAVYRPPRINPTRMRSPPSSKQSASRPRSAPLIDEFIAAELTDQPLPEASIGSAIAAGTAGVAGSGQRTAGARERREAAERARYEEDNFVRLPAESKKEKRKRGAGSAREGMVFGGEEMAGLVRDAERVGRGDWGRGGGMGARGKKRGGHGGARMTVDGPRGDGRKVDGGKRRRVR